MWVTDSPANLLPSLRGTVMGPEMGKISKVSFGPSGIAGNGNGGGAPGHVDQNQKPNKVAKPKPMSKKLSGNISTCSAKLTEVLSWQSKLDQNASGLNLAMFFRHAF